MCQLCIDLKIPERLWLSDRTIADSFVEGTLFYRRFNSDVDKDNWIKDNVSHSIFPLKTDSYNCSTLCKNATDVLYNTRADINDGNHFVTWGIISLPLSVLSEINEEINKDPLEINGEKRIFRLIPVHVPEDCNYPHSEIHVFEGQQTINVKTPKSIGVLIRSALIDKITIIKKPGVESNLVA